MEWLLFLNQSSSLKRLSRHVSTQTGRDWYSGVLGWKNVTSDLRRPKRSAAMHAHNTHAHAHTGHQRQWEKKTKNQEDDTGMSGAMAASRKLKCDFFFMISNLMCDLCKQSALLFLRSAVEVSLLISSRTFCGPGRRSTESISPKRKNKQTKNPPQNNSLANKNKRKWKCYRCLQAA